MFKKSFTGLVASVAMSAIALGVSAQESRADHAPTHDWTGPYIGALVGIGSFEAEADVAGGPSCSGDSCYLTNSGFMGGLTVGWNAQDGHMVYGIVGDVMFGDISSSLDFVSQTFDELTLNTDLFATIRGRAGVAADDIYVYGTVGVAILDGDVTLSGGGPSESTGFTALGGVVGAGAELAITEDVSFQAELLYAIFDESVDVSGGEVDIDNFYSVRFGVIWHF